MINNIIPKSQKADAKIQSTEETCICPYLQTEIKFNLKVNLKEYKDFTNDPIKNYKT